jgi:hypothetical protein
MLLRVARATSQLIQQDCPDEGMDTEPTVVGSEPRDEESARLRATQQIDCVRTIGQRDGEAPVHSVDDRGAQHQLTTSPAALSTS